MLADEFLGGLVLPLPIILIRLGGATLLAALQGIEREATGQQAGLRTHMLVGVAACSFALITVQMMSDFGDTGEALRMDPIRLVEATTAGVAFLAAGMIVLARGRVRNLTTGAGMWLTASVGLAVGLGYWAVAVPAALIGLLITGLLRLFE
jgi:putative Mg2+ transporter-C (MgtC) family protein